ncbi:hypothetical protein MBLNU459_g0023t1 [Dothideomycetes sp. NU459]
MRRFFILAASAALIAAQDIDATGPPMGVYITQPWGPVVTASTITTEVVTAFADIAKRDAICIPQPTGIAYTPTSDTTAFFVADAYYSVAALSATTPSGYVNVYTNTNAASNANNYLGFTLLQSYDVNYCASQCSAIHGCSSFNIYFERDPSVSPDSILCSNPPAVIQVKCVWWGGLVSVTNAVNYGQARAGFDVAIAGSNGYVNATAAAAGPSITSAVAPPSVTMVDAEGASYAIYASQDTNQGAFTNTQASGSYTSCMVACDNNSTCTAFTYVGGIGGFGSGTCWLKTVLGQLVPSEANVVSGVRLPGISSPSNQFTAILSPSFSSSIPTHSISNSSSIFAPDVTITNSAFVPSTSIISIPVLSSSLYSIPVSSTSLLSSSLPSIPFSGNLFTSGSLSSSSVTSNYLSGSSLSSSSLPSASTTPLASPTSNFIIGTSVPNTITTYVSTSGASPSSISLSISSYSTPSSSDSFPSKSSSLPSSSLFLTMIVPTPTSATSLNISGFTSVMVSLNISGTSSFSSTSTTLSIVAKVPLPVSSVSSSISLSSSSVSRISSISSTPTTLSTTVRTSLSASSVSSTNPMFSSSGLSSASNSATTMTTSSNATKTSLSASSISGSISPSPSSINTTAKSASRSSSSSSSTATTVLSKATTSAPFYIQIGGTLTFADLRYVSLTASSQATFVLSSYYATQFVLDPTGSLLVSSTSSSGGGGGGGGGYAANVPLSTGAWQQLAFAAPGQTSLAYAECGVQGPLLVCSVGGRTQSAGVCAFDGFLYLGLQGSMPFGCVWAGLNVIPA